MLKLEGNEERQKDHWTPCILSKKIIKVLRYIQNEKSRKEMLKGEYDRTQYIKLLLSEIWLRGFDPNGQETEVGSYIRSMGLWLR